MAKKRVKPVKVLVVVQGVPPFELEIQEYNVGNVIAREVSKRVKEWQEATYYIENYLGETVKGIRYNR